ncbi:hypothetical protein ZHAS_00009811 [Anopheles sinensis]|uniref:Uncharacterized protein n=1 Tax=Anopheles sinensis TaxID=74873 RepID=A0A084VVY7_ANOSI|nr:hypothetical protein ZHAS_00009811 [Anopheles sinensis]
MAILRYFRGISKTSPTQYFLLDASGIAPNSLNPALGGSFTEDSARFHQQRTQNERTWKKPPRAGKYNPTPARADRVE